MTGTLLKSEVESLSRELESVHNNFNTRRDKFEEQLLEYRRDRDDAMKEKLNLESRLKQMEQKLKISSERATDAIVQKQRFEEKVRTYSISPELNIRVLLLTTHKKNTFDGSRAHTQLHS